MERKQGSWEKISFIKGFRLVWHFLGWRLLLGLSTAIFSLAIFVWLADEVFEGETKNFDEAIRASIHQFASPALTEIMKIFSLLGSVAFLAALGACVSIILILLRWKRAVVLFLITMVGEILIELAMKSLFHRARPEPFFNYPLPSSFSFPSGHALGSFCFYGILAWLVAARLQNRALKIVIWTSAILLVALIGISRIYLGVHYPSDVAAGYLTALIWTISVAAGDVLFARRRTKKHISQ